MKQILITLYLLTIAAILLAQDGYDIKIKIDGYDQPEIYLGYFYADKQYLKDTTALGDDGYYHFKGQDTLEQGVYLVVLPPDNNYFQLILDDDHEMVMETAMPALTAKMKVKGSTENEVLYDYISFLGKMREKASPLQEQIKKAEEAGEDKTKFTDQLGEIDKEVRAKQNEIVEQHGEKIVGAIIKANLPFDTPEFDGETEEEVKRKAYYWQLEHYFDNIDLGDPRIMRSPFLFQKVIGYTDKSVIQHPDTISKAVDRVLNLMRPSEETFKFYLIHFLNKYANSKIVGQDAVYVHLVDEYYKKGDAPWTEEEQLKKIIDQADKTKPLLIGKTAPNITMYNKDNEPIALHDFDSKYTVLYFWKYDCGHCKKATPKMIEFYNNFKDKGVEVFGICTATWKRDDDGKISLEEVDKCWDYIEENGSGIWLNTVDAYHRSRYKSVYDINSTPQIYILDENKEILSKRIGADQISEVMDRIIEADQKAWEEQD